MINKTLFLLECALFTIFTSLQSQNLIQNGNFEQGYVGFTSGLRYLTVSDRTAGVFGVGTDSREFQVDFPSCSAHSGVGNKMMIVNGSTTVSTKVWEQVVDVVPNQTYAITFWYQNVTPVSDNLGLSLTINNMVIAQDSTAFIAPCVWYSTRVLWNSGSNTLAVVRILDTYNIFTGDDFALDDISFEAYTVIPINLIDFTATKAPKSVNLAWSTASEIQSSHFEIEKSLDGKQFSFLEKLQSIGNSNSIKQYTTLDNTPSVGVNYYRLKSVDIDGKETFSKIVSVDFIEKTKAKVFPNPTNNNQVTLSLETANEGVYQIEWLDLVGRVRQTQTKTAFSGINNWETNVSSLENGIYLVRIRSGKQVLETIRFIKM